MRVALTESLVRLVILGLHFFQYLVNSSRAFELLFIQLDLSRRQVWSSDHYFPI